MYIYERNHPLPLYEPLYVYVHTTPKNDTLQSPLFLLDLDTGLVTGVSQDNMQMWNR